MEADHIPPSVGGSELRTIFSRRVQKLLCGMGRHDLVLKIEPARIALKCVSCPYETAGWILPDTRPRAIPGVRRPARAA